MNKNKTYKGPKLGKICLFHIYHNIIQFKLHETFKNKYFT